ncbi:MAG: hypothetical protein WD266_05735 [Balneolales bacterium]
MTYHTLSWLYIMLLALAVQLFLPWWSVAIVSAAVGAWLGRKSLQAFLSGFAGIASLWLIASTYIHFSNEGILSGRIADMMGLPNAFFLILVTALCGGIVGGLSSLTGYLLMDLKSGSK